MSREGFRARSVGFGVESGEGAKEAHAGGLALLVADRGLREAQDRAPGLGVGGCGWLPCCMGLLSPVLRVLTSFPAEPPQPPCPISGGCLSLWLQASDLGAGRWETRTFLSGHQGGTRAPFPSSSHGSSLCRRPELPAVWDSWAPLGLVQGERALGGTAWGGADHVLQVSEEEQ